jgi:membrane peptidoglycan carboxypeptidase
MNRVVKNMSRVLKFFGRVRLFGRARAAAAGGIFTRALLVTALLLTASAGYMQKKHLEAEAMLDQVDLRARNAGGATFYASKKRLFVGQEMTRADLVRHLQTVNYVQSDDPALRGSYVLTGEDTLRVNPRLSELQPVTAVFRRGRIMSLTVEATPFNASSGAVEEAAVEPEPLGAFILSIDGEEASKMFVRRYTIQYEDFKDTHLLYAVLASEDSLFMTHNGTRFDRMLINLLLRRRGGGSSITAQVIKNSVSLDRSYALTRKLDEMFLASALEGRMSKEEILTHYVNDVFLGGGRGAPNLYGFLAAAEEYFGRKSISELTLGETCTLVAMLPKPSYFLRLAQKNDYAELTEWRDRVLRLLNENWPERYTPQMIEAARAEQLRFVDRGYVEQPMDLVCRAFVDYAAGQQPLVELENLPPSAYAGLHFYTSVDPDLMRESQALLDERLPAIERRFPPVKPSSCGGQGERLLGSIVALDPRSGEIITMTGSGGGKDGVRYSSFALNAKDAPASTIKPFWFAQAVAGARTPDGGRFTAATVLDPSASVLDGWRPEKGLGGAGRARAKLASSADDYAVSVMSLVGLREGSAMYERLTGNAVSEPTGQLAIGFGAGTEVSPLRLARAYSVFGNSGAVTEANPVSHVYLDGREVSYKLKPARQVFDAGAAYVTAQMMRSVLGYGPDGVYGTARAAFARTGLSPNEVEMAGKTGSGPHSVWMVSVSPRLVVVVMIGYLCRSEIKNSGELYAKDTAALVWSEFMRSLKKYRPDLLKGRFERPQNVTEGRIDRRRGCLSNALEAASEFFIAGTEPARCGDAPAARR